jgi:ribonuclease HII
VPREKAAVIAGVDEAGRGALAGPVVAAACILPAITTFPDLLRDSKQLTPRQRDTMYLWIKKHCLFGTGAVSASEIDAIGILEATQKAMQAAVAALAAHCHPTYLLVDGCDQFWFDYPHTGIIRGDQTEPCISAASIVAKVMRDRKLKNLSKKFIHYGFAQHKGYGTAEHMATIREIGPSAEHRHSFLKRVTIRPKAVAR